MSTAEVASSSNRTLGRERIARARQRSCFWPCERLDPPEAIGAVRDRKIFLFSAGWTKAVVELAVDDSGNVDSGLGVWVVDGIRWTRIRASRSW
jgi:hypothetical protein